MHQLRHAVCLRTSHLCALWMWGACSLLQLIRMARLELQGNGAFLSLAQAQAQGCLGLLMSSSSCVAAHQGPTCSIRPLSWCGRPLCWHNCSLSCDCVFYLGLVTCLPGLGAVSLAVSGVAWWGIACFHKPWCGGERESEPWTSHACIPPPSPLPCHVVLNKPLSLLDFTVLCEVGKVVSVLRVE